MKTKKFLSVLLSLIMIISIIPMTTITSSAAYENTYSNTGNQRKDIVGVAKTQIGYREGNNNDTKYGDWYGLPNQPWCAMFVSWCAKQADIPTSILEKTARAHPDNFDIPYYDGASYTPKPGDLFFKKGFTHVGLVYYVDGNYFYTIEGNSNNTGSSEGVGVFSLKRKISDFYFGVPNYSTVEDTIPTISNAKGISHSEISINWSKVSSATKYKVERRKSGTDDYVVAKSSTTSTSFTDAGLEKGQRYFYKVTAYNGSTKLGTSDSVGAYTKFSPPVVTAVSDSKLKVSWDSVSKAVDYTVMRRESGAEDYEEIKTVTGTSFTDTGLSANTKYYYWIKANCNVDGADIVAKSTSNGQYTLTKAPIINKTDDTSQSEIFIGWNSVDGASSYRVERRKSGDEKYITVKSSTTETSYTDSGLLTGERYYYRVYAKNEGGESASSESVGVYTKAKAPTIVVLNDTQLKITWNGISGAENYTVMRRKYNEESYSEIKTVTGTAYTDTNLSGGTKYYYWIKANCVVDDNTYIAKSTTGGNFTQIAKPTYNVVSDTAINLSWKSIDGPGDNASYKYIIQRKKSSESSYKNIATVSGTSYSDTGLTYSSIYDYRIQAVDTSNTVCSTSVVVSAKTSACSHPRFALKNVKSATCTENGYTGDSYCTVCGVTIKIGTQTNKINHTYTSSVTTPATHLVTGVMTYTCSCGDSYTEEIAKMADHSYTKVVTAPTCTGQGYTTYTCSCGDSYVAKYVNALGHDMIIDEAIAPDCVNAGLTEGTHCSRCNAVTTKQENIPALSHSFENGICKICGVSDPSYVPEEPVYNYTFNIQLPSRTEIRNKDGIWLHANVEGTAPNGSYVRWESSNGYFDTSADGSNLKIIAKNKGYTTFTAILCAADGTELARDTVEMYSKSGFFDKIGGFFRSLFGTTKIYES